MVDSLIQTLCLYCGSIQRPQPNAFSAVIITHGLSYALGWGSLAHGLHRPGSFARVRDRALHHLQH